MERVAVIGAGIIGLSVAYELQNRNVSVVLVDPRNPGTGASDGNTGWIVPVLSGPVPAPGLPRQVARWAKRADSPFRVDLRFSVKYAWWLYRFWRNCTETQYRRGLEALGNVNAEAFAGFERWRDEGLTFEWERQGVLFVAEDASYIEHLVHDADALAGAGYEPVDWVRGSLLREIEPALAPLVECGVFASREGHVRPETLIAALVTRLRERGATFIRGHVEAADKMDRSRVRHIRASGQTIEADAFVIAAGAWTGTVGKHFGTNLPVIAGKGYSLTIENPRVQARQPLYLADARIACTPFAGTSRYAGTMELTTTGETISATRLAVMSISLDRFLPGWNQGTKRIAWSGLRPMTPDGLPLIGKAPELDNVYIASGHGMLGVTMAPVTGEVVADLLTTGTARQDISAFDPGRF